MVSVVARQVQRDLIINLRSTDERITTVYISRSPEAAAVELYNFLYDYGPSCVIFTHLFSVAPFEEWGN